MVAVTRHQQEQDSFKIKVQLQEIQTCAQLYWGNFIGSCKMLCFQILALNYLLLKSFSK